MSIDLRLPNITGSTDKEQLAQVKSYLFQLTEQLQWALNNVSTTPENYTVISHVPIGVASSSSSSSHTPSAQNYDIEEVFDELKPLIIKSADIVSEIDTTVKNIETDVDTIDGQVKDVEGNVEGINKSVDTIDTLTTDLNKTVGNTEEAIQNTNKKADEASSAVGTLDKAVKDTAAAVDTLNDSVGDINDDIKELREKIIEITTNAYIRQGLLYYENSIPVYGFEVGQRNAVNGAENFNKYARFTADRLSFYDQNNHEVAYISDNKLYIRNAEITSSYKIGGRLDTVMPNGDVVKKWVGRG